MEAYNQIIERATAASLLATKCFLFSLFIIFGSILSGKWMNFSSDIANLAYWGPALNLCLYNFFLRYWFKGFSYKVAVRSAFLGAAFSTGMYLTSCDNEWKLFGLYMMILTTFHYMEFITVALTNPTTLSIDSFILNHSVQYGVAAVASWVEWAVEFFFFPGVKPNYFWLTMTGLLICIAGEAFRLLAIVTAKTNFNHTVQFVKKPDHVLVTHGVYSLCRHPAYVGWFYWSIGTQIILLNPVCAVIYALASWMFFNERVYMEELTLLSFFGSQYADYQKKVGTGLPFIEGFVAENTQQRVKDEHWSY